MGSDACNSSNPTAVLVFGLFTVVTLGVTVWARQRTKTKEDFAAGRARSTGPCGSRLAVNAAQATGLNAECLFFTISACLAAI
jgi:Na+(H+)/acetate symporter ActP